jgi:hypothetical protein
MADKHFKEYLKQNPTATIDERKRVKPDFIKKMD